MFSTGAVVALCALSAFAAAGTSGVVFLLRELARERDRRIEAEVKLTEARKQTLSEAKASIMDLQKVATDHIELEKQRIESRRLARQQPLLVQIHKGAEEAA